MNVFTTDTDSILRIIISAPIVYLFVILYIRVIGKRSTSQMNSFDWIVTVAMGSLVGTTIVVKDISVTEGVLAIILLMTMQYGLTKIMLHSKITRKVVRSQPRILLYKGAFLEQNMKNERVLKSEIMSSIREKGYKNVEQVYAVVLETDANLSVIPNDNDDSKYLTLRGVEGMPDELAKELKT